MTNTGRKGNVILMGVVAMLVAGRASAQEGLALHVVNYAAVPPDVLSQAMARVVRIYDSIGVGTVWVKDTGVVRKYQDGRLHLTILLLSREMTEKKIAATGIAASVLGQAHLPSGRASIFCDRISAVSLASKLLAIPLSAVIAHEVGHLVLQVNSHSRSGLMSADMDMRTMQLPSFNEIEARTIRTTLMEAAALAASR